MRITIIYFIGFLFYAAFLVVLDYIQDDKMDLSGNIFHAAFVTVFVRVMFWLEHKLKKTSKETGQHQE